MVSMTGLGECAGCGEAASALCSHCGEAWCSDCEGHRVHVGTCLPDAQLVRAALVPIEHFDLIDRRDANGEAWVGGEWDGEPDLVEWIENGWRCLVVRHMTNGHLNGYVGIPPGHPAHGVTDNDLAIRVHGGVTYASPNTPAAWVKHLTVDLPGLWWIGFDTGHLGDLSPGFERLIGGVGGGGTYKPVAYCMTEVRMMISQLEEMRDDE